MTVVSTVLIPTRFLRMTHKYLVFRGEAYHRLVDRALSKLTLVPQKSPADPAPAKPFLGLRHDTTDIGQGALLSKVTGFGK